MRAALSHGWTLGCLSRESQLGIERASNVGATHFSLLLTVGLVGLAACTPTLTSQWNFKPETPFPPSAAFRQGVCDGNRNETRTMASCLLLLSSAGFI